MGRDSKVTEAERQNRVEAKESTEREKLRQDIQELIAQAKASEDASA